MVDFFKKDFWKREFNIICKQNILKRYWMYFWLILALEIFWVLTQLGGDFGDEISGFLLIGIGYLIFAPFIMCEYLVIKKRLADGVSIFTSVKNEEEVDLKSENSSLSDNHSIEYWFNRQFTLKVQRFEIADSKAD
jgi:hypothetical protein